jgi:hypothetical protein
MYVKYIRTYTYMLGTVAEISSNDESTAGVRAHTYDKENIRKLI